MTTSVSGGNSHRSKPPPRAATRKGCAKVIARSTPTCRVDEYLGRCEELIAVHADLFSLRACNKFSYDGDDPPNPLWLWPAGFFLGRAVTDVATLRPLILTRGFGWIGSTS